MQYIGNVPNMKDCKIRWWSLDELLLKLLFHSRHSVCGLAPFVTSMHHWIKRYELAPEVHTIVYDFAWLCVGREIRSCPKSCSETALCCLLTSPGGPRGKWGYVASSFGCLAWPHPQCPGEPTFELPHTHSLWGNCCYCLHIPVGNWGIARRN